MEPIMAMRQEPAVYLTQSNAGQSRQMSGVCVTKQDAGVEVWKPSWKGTQTVFRPYPSLRHDDDTQFYPYRMGDTDYFGHWIRQFTVAWGVGSPAVTFLMETSHSFDAWQTPLGLLNSVIGRACKEQRGRPEWAPLVTSSKDRGKSLTMPKTCYMMQGALMMHNSKQLFGNGRMAPGTGPNSPCVLMLSGGVGKKLIDMLSVEKPTFARTDGPYSFEDRYVEGDPVGLDAGRFITFFECGHDPRNKYAAQPVNGNPMISPMVNPMAGGQTKSGGSFEERGFDLFLSPTAPGCGPATMNSPELREMVRSKWRHWEDILYFPTEVEQAHMLNRVFPATAIMAAFADNPSWILDETRAKAVNQTQFVNPGYPPAAGVPGFGPPGFGGPVAPPVQPGWNQPWQAVPAAAALWQAPPTAPAVAPPVAPQFAPPAASPVAPPVSSDGLPAHAFWGAEPAAAVDPAVPAGTLPAWPTTPPAAPPPVADKSTSDAIARLLRSQQTGKGG